MTSAPAQAGWKQTFRDGSYACASAVMAWPIGCLQLVLVSCLSAAVPAASAFAFGRLTGVVQNQDVSNAWGSITVWLNITFAVILTGAVCRIAFGLVSDALGRKLELHVSRQVLQHAGTLDQAYFEDPDCQDQLARARNQPGKACLSFVLSTCQVATGLVQTVSILALLFWIDAVSGLVLTALILPMLLIHRWLTKQRYLAERNKTAKQRWATYYLKSCTAYLKTPILKVYGLHPLLTGRFTNCIEQLNEIDSEIARKQAIGLITESLIIVAGLLATAVWIIRQTVSGTLPFESFVTFWVAAAQFRGCLPGLLGNAAVSMQMLMHLGDLRLFFESRAVMPPNSGVKPGRPRGELRLEEVTFAYRSDAAPALQNVSLSISAGETVAIVGPNGAGKTTLARLLLRLYHPCNGTVCIDGYDLSTLNLHEYHRHTAYVGHDPIRFEATLEESIAFGDWDKMSRDAHGVRDVAASLNLTSMIERMPNGFETRLGCRFGEHDLSAGQWQKIAIARALARDPAILIMDEPTANLDARYEFELLGALKRLAAGRTTVMISHRLSTLRVADRIVVMEEGRVVDQGTHDELVRRRGMYAELYRTQAPFAA